MHNCSFEFCTWEFPLRHYDQSSLECSWLFLEETSCLIVACYLHFCTGICPSWVYWLLFCCFFCVLVTFFCNKTGWQKQLMKGRVDLSLQFQRGRVHHGTEAWEQAAWSRGSRKQAGCRSRKLRAHILNWKNKAEKESLKKAKVLSSQSPPLWHTSSTKATTAKLPQPATPKRPIVQMLETTGGSSFKPPPWGWIGH